MEHYHIEWDDDLHGKRVDYAPFDTQADALRVAANLVRPRERYVIRKFDGQCLGKCHMTVVPPA